MTAQSLTVQVVHAPNGTGLNWFVDVWHAGGWDHHASFRTKDEADECARQLQRAAPPDHDMKLAFARWLHTARLGYDPLDAAYSAWVAAWKTARGDAC